jgi:hypothetical protein
MNPNPVNKFGDRNYQCCLYERCKNHTLEKQWTFWTCAECEHKLMGTAITLIGPGTKNTPSTQYGKFQIVSKSLTRRYSPLLEKITFTREDKDGKSKPHPFQFN